MNNIYLMHMAPPANRVNILMADLLGWLKTTPDHALIKSCVFHYEFEFIHPFIEFMLTVILEACVADTPQDNPQVTPQVIN